MWISLQNDEIFSAGTLRLPGLPPSRFLLIGLLVSNNSRDIVRQVSGVSHDRVTPRTWTTTLPAKCLTLRISYAAPLRRQLTLDRKGFSTYGPAKGKRFPLVLFKQGRP